MGELVGKIHFYVPNIFFIFLKCDIECKSSPKILINHQLSNNLRFHCVCYHCIIIICIQFSHMSHFFTELITWPRHQNIFFKISSNAINFEIKAPGNAGIGLSSKAGPSCEYLVSISSYKYCS